MSQEHSASQQCSSKQEPVIPGRRKTTIQQKQGQRAFGNVLQEQVQPRSGQVELGSSSSSRKPNPTERLWNPSPFKRRHHQRENKGRAVKSRKESRGDIQDDQDKENAPSSYVQVLKENKPEQSKLIPGYKVSEAAPSGTSELNSSFTEKISNLDLSSGIRVSVSPPSPPVVKSPSPRRPKSNKLRSLIETLDVDHPYFTEILNYWHKLEMTHAVDPNYMNKQREVSFKMRTILVDWLVEVGEEYSMVNATLHRCVHLIDRFLSKAQITRSHFQLLGTTCLFVACKLEEIQPPETGDLVYLTDNTYDKAQLLEMECVVLSKLNFDLLTPTAHEFTEYFSHALQLTPTARQFSHYIIELTLLDGERFLGFISSVVSMAACYVAIKCCGDVTGTVVSLEQVCRRVVRLNVTPQYMVQVETVAARVYVSLLSSANTSVCSKYSRFQERTYLMAIASAAACSSVPWC